MVKNNQGFVYFAPIVIIAAILLLGLSFKSFQDQSASSLNENVLSEAEIRETEEGEEDRDESSNESGEERDLGEEDEEEIEIEDEDEEEDENEAEDEVEIEEEDEEVRPARLRVRSRNGEFELESEGVFARSNFPISVNSETNELTVTTPRGEKVVAILPNQAVENMIENGVIDTSLSVEIQEGEIEIEYEIEGVDNQQLLGLFDIGIVKKLKISSENGEVLSSSQSLLYRILDAVSF